MANPFTGSFDDYLSPLAIGEDKITALACQFAKTYKHLALHSTQQFLPTPISALPTGQEKGQFLSIDVGGSNLRVGFIELLGHETETRRGSRSSTRRKAASNGTCDEGQDVRINRIFEKAWPIREHLKMDNAEDLFCWIGDCIAEVVRDSVRATLMEGGDAPQELVMGITFSFPMMYDVFHSIPNVTIRLSFVFTCIHLLCNSEFPSFLL